MIRGLDPREEGLTIEKRYKIVGRKGNERSIGNSINGSGNGNNDFGNISGTSWNGGNSRSSRSHGFIRFQINFSVRWCQADIKTAAEDDPEEMGWAGTSVPERLFDGVVYTTPDKGAKDEQDWTLRNNTLERNPCSTLNTLAALLNIFKEIKGLWLPVCVKQLLKFFPLIPVDSSFRREPLCKIRSPFPGFFGKLEKKPSESESDKERRAVKEKRKSQL
ncbi:hypothetical protein RUM44_011603 [Polyplax serrata]|uniref:Uncharacterized protein n=1 Tax=Polyplax serrata TaxID=468196 RepID=A0ABR1AQH2_POLSC